MTLRRYIWPIWDGPFLVQPAMCSRHLEATVKLEEEVAQVTSTLTRAYNPRLWTIWAKLIKEKELYLGVSLRVLNRGRYWDLKRLYLYVLK